MSFDPTTLPTSYLLAMMMSPEILLQTFKADELAGPAIIQTDAEGRRSANRPQSAHAAIAQARLMEIGAELDRRIPIPAQPLVDARPVATSLPGEGE